MTSTCFLIGIAGGTGSGKSTLASKIVQALPPGRAALIPFDAYYRDRSHLPSAARQAINFDEPGALQSDLLAAHLQSLQAGRGVDVPRYDFASHTRLPDVTHLEPCPIVIVEGILLFAVPALVDVFDLRLFVDTDDDVRLLRRIKRDIVERGRDIDAIAAQYLGTVRPMHGQYVAPSRQHAHLIIPEGGDNAGALDVIVGRLLHALALMGL